MTWIFAALCTPTTTRRHTSPRCCCARSCSAAPRPNLLGAITGLTQARFPVHAPSHFSDGFQTTTGTPPAQAPKALVGTTIYSQQGAPVIAVADGQILGFGHTPSLGRYVSLRDSYGNTYTYAELGSVAKLYPVLVPHAHNAASPRAQQAGPSGEPAPLAPASAGTQSRAPLSEGAATGLALGVGTGLEAARRPIWACAARRGCST